jgi:nitrite reductase/ring-hydroxylating ferredoxin subunit
MELAHMSPEFLTVFKTSQIAPGTVVSADVRGLRVAVANIGGTYYAFDDTCTHEQCSLSEQGELAHTTITCTCHNAEFDIRTGKVLAPPAVIPLKVFRTRIDGDLLQIEI